MNEEILKQLTRIADALEASNSAPSTAVIESDAGLVEVKSFTHEDLKALCLSKSREDIANKPKLKALLKKYDGVKVSDVKEGDLIKIKDAIESGDY